MSVKVILRFRQTRSQKKKKDTFYVFQTKISKKVGEKRKKNEDEIDCAKNLRARVDYTDFFKVFQKIISLLLLKIIKKN